MIARLPPGPKSRYPLENLIAFSRDIIGFISKMADEYGDASYFRIGPERVVLLNHPDYIKEVLTTQNHKFVKGRPLELAKSLLGEGILTSEGATHHCHSRMIQPAFHRGKVESYVPHITDSIKAMTGRWEDGKQVDMKFEMTQLSTIIAGKTLFNENVEKVSPEIINALDTATNLFGRVLVPCSEYFLKLPLPGNLRFNKAKKRLDQLIYGIMEKRRSDKEKFDDLLTMLMFPYEDRSQESGLTDLEIRDEALTLFLTAFDTTSTALIWTWYLLSQHPDVEQRLHKEIEEVLGRRTPELADIGNLQFTRKVFTEAMRLYPPTYIISRQALEDVIIGGYLIPKRSTVLVSPYLIHRNPRYYEDPDSFNPAIREVPDRSSFRYFPFSAGPRMCIGEPMAWIQGILVLAMVSQNWKCRLEQGYPVEVQPLMNLKVRDGLKMNLIKR